MTDLASARTTKRTSCLRTDVHISKKERLSCKCAGQVCAEHRHLHYSFVAAARAPAWTSHQGFYGNEHLTLAKTRVLGFASSPQGTWASWSRREMRFLFGSAVFFFCNSILKSVLAVLFKIAFSFSRKRIRVRVLIAERFYTFFSSFLQARRQSENFTLAEI